MADLMMMIKKGMGVTDGGFITRPVVGVTIDGV